MKKQSKIPDAINASSNINLSLIPTKLIRTNTLSTKAKSVLFILLSNSKGWHSHFNTMLGMMKESETTLRTALKELEKEKYLIRIQLRDKKTKQLASSLWLYTNESGKFNFNDIYKQIKNAGLIIVEKAVSTKATNGFATNGKCSAKKNKKKEKKNKKKRKEELFVTNAPHVVTHHNKSKYITSHLFDKFWSLYPKRPNSTKSKAVLAWDKLCKLSTNKGTTLRPKWKEIKKAIKTQSKSERWTKQPNYIPHHSTWLNQHKWLDDAKSLGIIEDYNKPKKFKSDITTGYGNSSFKLTKKSETM